jgi:hypothetical protein
MQGEINEIEREISSYLFRNQRATPTEQRQRNGHAIEKVGAVSQ